MVMINPEIAAGEGLVKRIKRLIYSDVAWTPALAFTIGHHLSRLKQEGRKFFSGLDAVALMGEMDKWPDSDLIEVLESEKKHGTEAKCKNDGARSVGAILR